LRKQQGLPPLEEAEEAKTNPEIKEN